MENREFKEGTVIMGKDLKGHKLCKVLSEDMKMQGFHYKLGMNEDINLLEKVRRHGTGLHFCLLQDVCKFLCHGSRIAIVSVADEEEIYVGYSEFRAHKLMIERVMLQEKICTWKYLVANGLNLHTASINGAVGHASLNGYLEVLQYMQESGVDIAYDKMAVMFSARKGYLEIVKYLHEHGADITAFDNCAIYCAAGNGHLDVVKYLYEHEGDITTNNNEAVNLATY